MKKFYESQVDVELVRYGLPCKEIDWLSMV